MYHSGARATVCSRTILRQKEKRLHVSTPFIFVFYSIINIMTDMLKTMSLDFLHETNHYTDLLWYYIKSYHVPHHTLTTVTPTVLLTLLTATSLISRPPIPHLYLYRTPTVYFYRIPKLLTMFTATFPRSLRVSLPSPTVPTTVYRTILQYSLPCSQRHSLPRSFRVSHTSSLPFAVASAGSCQRPPSECKEGLHRHYDTKQWWNDLSPALILRPLCSAQFTL